ncbi:amino acid adenylation domain-containing protein [Paenibacillus sp.]
MTNQLYSEKALIAATLRDHRETLVRLVSEELPKPIVPYDRLPQSNAVNEHSQLSIRSITTELPEASAQELMRISNSSDANLHALLTTVAAVLTYKYAGTDYFLLGIPAIIIPVRIQPEITFKELLLQVRRSMREAQSYAQYPLEVLASEMKLPWDRADNPFFDIAVMLNAVHNLEWMQEIGTAFAFALSTTEQSIKIALHFNSNLYDESTAWRLLENYTGLIRNTLLQPDQSITGIAMTDDKWLTDLKHDLSVVSASPDPMLLHERFARKAVEVPEHTALIYKDQKLSYQTLNERAECFSAVLNDAGVGRGSIVAIRMERSFDMVAGILGILMAGGAYLPIEPGLPAERVRYMIEDSGTAYLLTSRDVGMKDTFAGCTTLYLEEALSQRVKESGLNVSPAHHDSGVRSEDPAYIIYTSGTTGLPKGTIVRHEQISSLLEHTLPMFEFSTADRWTLFHSFSFDFSVWEMFGALVTGAALIIVPEVIVKDTPQFARLLTDQNVTVINQTPSAFYQLIQAQESKGWNPRYVIFGGEALAPGKVAAWALEHPTANLINMYGITETTIHATFKKMLPQDLQSSSSNIGSLLPHLKGMVVDRDGHPTSHGVPGELWITGRGVAQGYLGKPELTQMRFVTHPLMGELRFYRSGDLVRQLENGELEYLGRMDQQVKIRGYRIETGEIVEQLLQHENIADAVVSTQHDDQDRLELVAYLICDEWVTDEDVRSYLGARLPAYMIPAHLYKTPSMPLTINGKLDFRQLMSVRSRLQSEAVYMLPRNDMEQGVHGVWQKHLAAEIPFGIHDSLFHIGGHSLTASLIINELNRDYGCSLTIRSIFEHPTIALLCIEMKQNMKEPYIHIPVIAEQESYVCSSAQERIFFHEATAGEHTTLYNMPVMLELKGPLNEGRLAEALHDLVERHTVLRSMVHVKQGHPYMRTSNHLEQDHYFEIVATDPDETWLEGYLQNFVQPFDLVKGPLFRAKLLKFSESRHLFLFDLHHIIADGTTLQILLHDLLKLYEGVSLEPLQVQYMDYAAWQKQEMAGEAMKMHESYWLEQFKDDVSLLALPLDFARKNVLDVRGDTFVSSCEPDIVKQLTDLAQQHHTTLFTVMLAAFNVLLHKYSNQEDIVVGTPAEGREHNDLKQLAGVFVNSLALRNRPEGTKSFTQFLEEVRTGVVAALEHQSYPFEQLVAKTGTVRDLNHHPLFDVWFTMQVSPEIQRSGSLHISSAALQSGLAKFDLSLYAVVSNENSLNFMWEYRTGLFRRETIQQMSEHFAVLLRELGMNASTPLRDIPLITEVEHKQVVRAWNLTDSEYVAERGIHRLFEQTAATMGHLPALQTSQESLTYELLNRMSNQLAHRLRRSGITRNTLVGLVLGRNPYLVAGIMGVLKAGGAYLPIDPHFPEERIKHMLHNSGVNLVLTDQEIEHTAWQSTYKGEVWTLGQELGTDQEVYPDLPSINEPNDMAYVLYTSGSTGSPKGVVITHDNLLNFVHAMSQRMPWPAGSGVLSLTTVSFDIFFVEMLLPLLKGMTVIMADEGMQQDPELLARFIEEQKVHTLQLTPSRLSMMLKHPRGAKIMHSVQQILVGGEHFPLMLLTELQASTSARIYNMYGPTETTIWSTAQELTSSRRTDIGTPLANTQVYVLDSQGYPVPPGIPGELYIGGKGVSGGYYRNAELTNERFLPNPFTGEGMMYRTGDLVRWIHDGCLMYMSRLDQQVKIRGYRIDTEEVQERMLTCDGVAQAVVVTKPSKNYGDMLVGYYTTGKPCPPGHVRKHLMELLPAYMIPGRLMHVDSFPYTPNGKLDRKRLDSAQVIQEQEQEQSRTMPVNDLERQVASIWTEVLELSEQISTSVSFFELGGNSLQASSILLMIHERLGAEVSLRQFFREPTIHALSDTILSLNKSKVMAIPTTPQAAYYPLSPAQRRMYFLYQLEGQGISYNMPLMVSVKGHLDQERIRYALDRLTQRHESLRTSFDTMDGKPVQRIEKNTCIPLSSLQAGSKEDVNAAVKSFIQPFSLEHAPLARVCIVHIAEEESLFMLDMHHIIADGVSTDIFIRDFLALYEGREPASASQVDYKDYSMWQRELTQTELYASQQAHWMDTLSGELPVLHLPTDHPRPPVKGYAGETVRTSLMPGLREQLNRAAANTGVTLNTILLAAYYTLLYRVTDQEDIIIGSPFANRQQADIQEVIGMFVNTLALRSYPMAGKTARQYILEVNEMLILAQENQDIPFENLIEQLELSRDMSRNPLFDTMFSYQSKQLQLPSMKELQVQPYLYDFPVSKFDLSLNILDTTDEMLLELEYSTELFEADTIHRYMHYYVQILLAYAEQPNQTLGDMDIVSVEERTKLLSNNHRQMADIPEDVSFYSLFEQAAKRFADQTALVYEGQELSYSELERQVSILGSVLQSKGAKAGSRVGVMLERSLQGVVAILAVLKTGAAYVPIDPAYPNERVAYMLSDCEAGWVICRDHTTHAIPDTINRIEMEQIDWEREPMPEYEISRPALNSQDLMYIIYTSGSTGRPKGVMIGHQQFVGMCHIWHQEYELSRPGFTLLQMASIAFDVFTGDLGRTLLYGGKLVICSEEEKYDFRQLHQLMSTHRVTLMESTSALIVPLMKYVEDQNLDISYLKLLIIGSDVCRVEDFKHLHEKFGADMRIINSYGVTEATVDSSYYEYTPGSPFPRTRVPIGRPLPNVRFYILDKRSKLVPTGVSGELYIGGIGVGDGYCNNVELSSSRYLPDPFVPGAKVYRTGDSARWLPDGNVEFLGRDDAQIKIRGLRIETGEIESVIRRHPLVSEAVVIARKDDNPEFYLCGYYTASADVDIQELKNVLAGSLPDFMIPSRWMRLVQMPLSSNGKIDPRLFPVPVVPEVSRGSDVSPPETELELHLVEIWKAVLAREQIGLDDNFFELGGNSMSILEINMKIREKLSLDFSVATLFRYPTIRSFITQLEQDERTSQMEHHSKEVLQEQAARIQDANLRKKEMLNRRRNR